MSSLETHALSLSMKNLSKVFRKGGQEIVVLKGINMSIQQGERISIVGASGVGKSTLLHIMGTLDRPSEGSLFYDETDVFSLNDSAIAKLRNQRIGFIFQFHHLLSEFSAVENVMMPSIIAGVSLKTAHREAEIALSDVGLGARLDHRPGELSGGEQQRVAIARAISRNPSILLADEPTGNLDSKTGSGIQSLLMELNMTRRLTLVVVTHDSNLAAQMDRRLRMADGALLEEGGP